MVEKQNADRIMDLNITEIFLTNGKIMPVKFVSLNFNSTFVELILYL
jgi:hypothetical protein